MEKRWSDYIPGTMEREVAPDIVFRPLRSWHSGVYAGEGLKEVKGDRSGCLHEADLQGWTTLVTLQPRTVTHRAYWNKKNGKEMSVFLSYPNGMGWEDHYFWEIYPVEEGDIERYREEDEMERRVVELLS